MQINPNTINFTSLFRFSTYIDSNGVHRETQNTTGRRADLDYRELAKLAKQRFKDFDKINIMPMNCSDGTEPYLIAHNILEVFGEKEAKKKVFPIIATDVDPFIINKFGKKGIVAFRPEDIAAFGNKFDKYFTEIPTSELPPIANGYSLDTRAFKLTQFFKNLFQFKVQDFQKRISQTKDQGNSVIIIRNCLAQAFGWPKTGLILADIEKTLKERSLFVIGQYDRDHLRDMVPTLKMFDFKEVGGNIFSQKYNTPVNKLKNIFSKLF